MVALDDVTDFCCFVHEDGTSDDCEVQQLPAAYRVVAEE